MEKFQSLFAELNAILTFLPTKQNSKRLSALLNEIDLFEEENIPQDKHLLGLFICLNRKKPLMKVCLERMYHFYYCYENYNYRSHLNGESRVLEFLRDDLSVIFDVGANVGEWTFLAAKSSPHATIHSLEIVPATREILKARFASLPQVTIPPCGLSDEPGVIKIKHYPDDIRFSSSMDYPHHLQHIMLDLPVITGDQYLKDQGIDHIDLLKIDVEGMEKRVLDGFQEAIKEKKIDAIQVEYGQVNIISKWLLRDIYQFFTSSDYTLGKIYPTYVDFKDYELKDENFIGANFLAISNTKKEWIDKLNS